MTVEKELAWWKQTCEWWRKAAYEAWADRDRAVRMVEILEAQIRESLKTPPSE